MRILHVVPSYIPAYRYGGPIRSVHGLCKGLAKLGHEVHVFTTNVDGEKDSDVPLGVPVDIDAVKVWYFPSRYLRRLFWSPQMKKTLEREVKSFDILHLHSIFLWPTWAAARAARRAAVPYIISPRGMLVKDLIARKSRFVKTAWLTLIERLNIEGASAIHVTSNVEEQEARKFNYNFPPFFVVPNGIDLSLSDTHNCSPFTMHQSPVSDNSSPFTLHGYLLYLGRINWKKGLDRLIQALPQIPDVQLVIAGNDEEHYRQTLDALAAKCGVSERLAFVGPVFGADKEALLKNAAMLVLPSYSENFGIVVLEAMADGCPVVVTPEVGAAEIVAKTGAGVVLDGNPELLGKGIRELLLNMQLLKEMGEQGKKAVAERYTWPAIAGQMESVYLDILETKKGAPA